MKRLVSATLGLLLALALISVTTKASEKSLFPYRVDLNNPTSVMGKSAGAAAYVYCDEKVGVLIYKISRGGAPQFAAVPNSAACQASRETVTFPYQSGDAKVFCDANAGVLIYDFTGPWHAQHVLVHAPDVCPKQ